MYLCVCVCVPECGGESEVVLLRDVDPVSGSGHHGLGIDGTESKMVAEFEASSVGSQVVDSQYVRIRCVHYQILHIPPRQVRTV